MKSRTHLHVRSLEATVRSAFSHNYSPQLICKKASEIGIDCLQECVFYRPPQFSVDVAAKAVELKRSPVDFIRFVQRCLEYFLTGEDTIRMFMFFAGIARNIKTTIVRIYGANSARKKMLYYWMREVFGAENVVVISSATAAWLKRKVASGFQTKGKIFILFEDQGDPKNNLRYQFERIYSEDKIQLKLTVRGEGGERGK